MPSVLLWACLAENLFLFAAQKNLRIFLSCFFTGRGRGGKRHLLLSACGRRAATSDWRNLKKRLRDLHAEQVGISSFLGWSLLLWDYQPPPTRIRSAQETMRKKASRPMGGSPFVFFGVTLSAQSDFLDLGGSELEGPDGLPLLILHLCDCNRSVGVVTVVLCAAALSRIVVPSVCFTPWSGVRIPLTTAPASLPCFRRWRRSAQLQFPYGSN